MPVTPETIAVALGRPTPAAESVLEQQWEMWIADAQRLITRRAERVGVTFWSLPADDVDYVVREAVVAHVKGADGTKTVDVRVDDASVARTESAPFSRRVEISDDLWDELGLKDSRSAFTITPYGARPAGCA